MRTRGISTTTLHLIESGVPQDSVLGPILYLIFTYDLRTLSGVLIGTFADDTAILSATHNPHIASAKLQRSFNYISPSETKSVHSRLPFSKKIVQLYLLMECKFHNQKLRNISDYIWIKSSHGNTISLPKRKL